MTWVEFFSFCFSWSNLLYSLILVVAVLYWSLVALGTLDLDFLEFDLDYPDLEAEGALDSLESSAMLGFLEWFNIGKVPLTIILSIAILFTWVLGIYSSFLLPELGTLIHNLFFIPYFFVALLLAKYTTNPLRSVFIALGASANQAKNVGSVGVLTADLAPGEISQLEVKIEGSPMKVNVKLAGQEKLEKGQQAIVISKDQTKGNNVYFVEPFDDWKV